MPRPSNEACASCKFAVLNDVKQLECRFNPPHVQMAFMQDEKGRPKSMTFAGWGIVLATQWCGQWTPSLTIATH